MYDDQDGQTTKVGTWGAYKYGGSGWTTHVLTLAFCLRDKSLQLMPGPVDAHNKQLVLIL
jgi:hypothetical protein